jgi:hypothetical protein
MQKYRIYGLLMVLMTLVGCRDMFIREIDFEGETEPEMLVLTSTLEVGQTPEIQVSHSFFFNRTDKRPDDWITDAQLTMRINSQTYTLAYRDSGFYTNPSIPPLAPRDTVQVVASHPKYATATAQQILPGQIKAQVASYELQSGWLVFDLDLDAYQGNPDDVIAIHAAGQLKAMMLDNPVTWDMNILYSNDIVFAQAQNAETEGYYGVMYGGLLYFPASLLQQPRRIRLFLDSYRMQYESLDWYKDIQIASLEVYVMAYTQAVYRFDQSQRDAYEAKYLPAPSGLPTQDENVMQEIMDEIQAMLGEQEPRLVYSNVDGGLGIVAGCSSSVCSYVFL